MTKFGNQETLKWENIWRSLCPVNNNIFLAFYSNMFDVNVFVKKDKFYREQMRKNNEYFFFIMTHNSIRRISDG